MSSENEPTIEIYDPRIRGIYLWLDDYRRPTDFVPNYQDKNWVWAKTAEEAIGYLRTGKILFASLDHDLTEDQMVKGGYLGQIYEDEQKSGYDVVVWLEEHPEFWPPDGVQVHTANPAGRARMQQVIDKHYGN